MGIRSHTVGVIGLLCIQANAFGGILQELDQNQQAQIRKGGQVAIFTSVENSAWPESKVVQKIEGVTPVQAAAVFHDYTNHSKYFPNLVSAKIVNTVDRSTVDVAYHLVVSFLWGMGSIEDHYTVRDHVSRYDSNQSYQIAWRLLESASVSRSEGEIRFEPYEGGTLMAYRTLVVPSRFGAGMVVDSMKQTAKDGANAVAKQVVQVVKHDPGLFQHEMELLNQALE